ncbi:hypothetical protein MKW94_000671 [Papaver nudicaule]|uniref:Transmembrane protein n=1 Tax=Papaver nudicaule TaxID=74823 RepID=A0AA41V4G6_PAPNU|nr:hypothetical protein [Papaver nudicaule]
MAKMVSTSQPSINFLVQKPLSPFPLIQSCAIKTQRSLKSFQIHAKLGGADEGFKKPDDKKKFITKEEEPEQYWQTAGEREGENPMMTPLPYIIIFGMSTPFIILAIGFFNGWIKVPIR